MGTLYTAQVTSQGGRDGYVRSSDGVIDLQVGRPATGEAKGTNPEQLFGAAYSACFHSALKSIAKSKQMDTSHSEVTANVTLHQNGNEYYLSVQLDVAVPGVSSSQVLELAEAAHKVCPYSKATRDNIEVELRVRAPMHSRD
ncbi:organic hydroperoxide resistance protein [Paenibacillus xerothermodurans]|uniref:Organic hydroperoxide resistance protein n=1 Tax=Paenibacillus xerothermodurans TaxID=1977292 RepID=A0A2W1NDT0_PAEXE|nr:organic hydroperoxide resistance protein [Paenibacillus xerothermodurans]PZE22124.1 organic hydroperoxide resistance protein [Paenibacillus xerothermodurans]